jgi:hypothetical protein
MTKQVLIQARRANGAPSGVYASTDVSTGSAARRSMAWPGEARALSPYWLANIASTAHTVGALYKSHSHHGGIVGSAMRKPENSNQKEPMEEASAL